MNSQLLWLLRSSVTASDSIFTQPSTWNYTYTMSSGNASDIPATIIEPNVWNYTYAVVPPATSTTTPALMVGVNTWNYTTAVTPPVSDAEGPALFSTNASWSYPLAIADPVSDTNRPVTGNGPVTWNFPLTPAPWTWSTTTAYDQYFSFQMNGSYPTADFALYGANSGVLNSTPLSVDRPATNTKNGWLFRPDGNAAISYYTSGAITYRRSGDTFSASGMGLSIISGLYVYSVNWSGDGTRLLVVGNGATYVCQQQTNQSYYYVAAAVGVGSAIIGALSADGVYAAFGYNGSISMYKWSGTVAAPTLTSLGVPSGASNFNYVDMAFSPDGNYLAATTSTGAANTSVVIFKRSGDTFTNLGVTTPATPGATGLAWSPDSSMLVVASSGTNTSFYMTHVGDTFNAAVTITGSSFRSVAWTKDGTKLYVYRTVAPSFKLYSRSGDTLVAETDPTVQPASVALTSTYTRTLTIHPSALYGP